MYKKMLDKLGSRISDTEAQIESLTYDIDQSELALGELKKKWQRSRQERDALVDALVALQNADDAAQGVESGEQVAAPLEAQGNQQTGTAPGISSGIRTYL
jgi:chromosome segregation ATPase